MKTKKTTFYVAGVFLMFVLSPLLSAQGTSPIKVSAISVMPATFKPGDAITIKITLENASAKTYGCSGMEADVYVFKQTPYNVSNLIWKKKVLTGSFAPGQKKSFTVTGFVVPADNYPELHIRVWSPVCAPDEFGQAGTLVIKQECMYKYYPKLEIHFRIPRLLDNG